MIVSTLFFSPHQYPSGYRAIAYLVSNIVTIVAVGLQMEFMILDKARDTSGQPPLEGLLSQGSERSFTQVMNVAVKAVDGHFFVLVVAQEIEPLCQEDVNHDRL